MVFEYLWPGSVGIYNFVLKNFHGQFNKIKSNYKYNFTIVLESHLRHKGNFN